MQKPAITPTADNSRLASVHPMPEIVETLLSALAGCGIVFLLAFFLSLESWVVSVLG